MNTVDELPVWARLKRLALRATIACVALLVGAAVFDTVYITSAHAQPSPRADTTRISLVVRPRVGDTLWLHLEQTMETRSAPVPESRSGASRAVPGARAPTTAAPEYGPVSGRAISQSTFMRLDAHSSVEFSDLSTTGLAVVTDSLSIRTGTGGRLGPLRPVVLAANDRRTQVNVTPDGAMSVANPGMGSATLAASLAGMPPMLPSRPVAIGERWERDVPLPSLPLTGVRTDAVVHAAFRLDSVTRGGRFAYVSLTGTLRREGAARDLPPGTQVATSGVLRGYLIVDRTRGWITEAETTIEVQSEVTPSVGNAGTARSLTIHLMQRMRVR